jgi:hypothetical protein
MVVFTVRRGETMISLRPPARSALFYKQHRARAFQFITISAATAAWVRAWSTNPKEHVKDTTNSRGPVERLL